MGRAKYPRGSLLGIAIQRGITLERLLIPSKEKLCGKLEQVFYVPVTDPTVSEHARKQSSDHGPYPLSTHKPTPREEMWHPLCWLASTGQSSMCTNNSFAGLLRRTAITGVLICCSSISYLPEYGPAPFPGRRS